MKKLFTILFILPLFCFSQDYTTLLPEIAWHTQIQNVVSLGTDTFVVDVLPIDISEPGAFPKQYGNYLMDIRGYRYKIISTTSTTVTVVDILNANYAPFQNNLGAVYQSAGNDSLNTIPTIIYDRLGFKALSYGYRIDMRTLSYYADSTFILLDSLFGKVVNKATTLEVFTGLSHDSLFVTPRTNAENDRAVNVPYWGAEEDLYTDYNIHANILYANSLGYDTSYVVTGSEPAGFSYWDNDNNTVSIVLKNGVIGQVFEEAFIAGQNDTGGILSNGKIATYKEEIGNSGNMRIWLTVASKDEPSLMTIGVITQDIEDGNTGKITTRGKARGFQTDGADYGETWVAKDILYKSSTIPGGFTNIPPEAPTPAQAIAIVLAAHPTNGTILVRPTFPQTLASLPDVNGTPLTKTGQFPMWDNDNSYFDFNFNIIDSLALYVPYINALYDVDLGEKNLTADSVYVNRLEIGGNSVVTRISYPLSGLSAFQQSLNLIVDGTDVYMETENVDGGNIPYVFDEERHILDCTTGAGIDGKARVQLTVGTVTDEQINYVYVVPTGVGVCELRSSTALPTDTFAWHSIVTIQDAASVTAHGALGLQRTTEALKHNGRGQLSYMRENIRWRGAQHITGGTSTIVSTTPLDVLVSAADILQLHRQLFPSRQVSIDGITISNATGAGSLSKNDIIYDLNDIDELADGSSIGNAKYFSYTIWATMASSDQTGNQSKLFVNLPTNFYGSESEAIGDVNNYDVRTAPEEYNNIAWLVSRVVQQRLGGSNNLVGDGIYSLTGRPMGSQGGGAGSTALTEFNDAIFHIYNNDDPTKIIEFTADSITTGTTRTISMADADVDLADIHTNSDSITAHRTDINTIYVGLSVNAAGISANADSLVVHRTAINTLYTAVSLNADGISDNSDSIIVHRIDIDNANAAITINAGNISDNTDSLVVHRTDINNANAAITINATNIQKNTDSLVVHRTDINTNIQNISDNSDSLAIHLDTLQSHNIRINQNTSDIAAIEVPEFATTLEAFTGLSDSTLMNPLTNAEFNRAMSIPYINPEENAYWNDVNISVDTAKANVIELDGTVLDLNNIAYTNITNTFTQYQKIESSSAGLLITNTGTASGIDGKLTLTNESGSYRMGIIYETFDNSQKFWAKDNMLLGSQTTTFAELNTSTGQWKWNNYLLSTSFSGTAVANIQVDASGNVITTAVAGSGVSFGTDNQIPYMNGTTDFQYDTDLTFDNTNLTVGGNVISDENRVYALGDRSGSLGVSVSSTGYKFTVNLTGDFDLTISVVKDGGEGSIELTQNSTGGYAFTLIGGTGYTTEVIMGTESEVNQTASSHTTVIYWRSGTTLYYGFIHNNL